MNLITNAAESIGEQGGVITVTTGVEHCDAASLRQSRLEERPAVGEFVYLQIADTGCGMDEETRRRLFDPFFTTKFTGRGLGLSAVLGIVRGHGGAIFVDSEMARGTTVKVAFPVATPM
jgi:signal transduction histidine kinase